MARKTKEEALATRNLLLDTAEHLFSTQGVANTSLHEIAETAGLTRGAIYWHFDNKSDLLTALWERVTAPLRASFDGEDSEHSQNDPLSRVRLKASYKARHIESSPQIRALLTILMLRCEFTKETHSAGEYFLREREHAYACVREDIDRAIAIGQLPASVDAEQAAIGLFGLIDGLCFHWLINPSRFSITTTTLTAIDAYLAGLSQTPSAR
jgi:TetR/AcrR family transcriptional regulator, acrAB operon repressor